MPSSRSLSIPVLLTALVVITYYYLLHPSHADLLSNPLAKMIAHDSDILADLHVSLRQTSRSSPPAVTVTVTNNSSRPLTILTWESPLDELALQLGLLSITPEGASQPVDIPTVKVSRKLPPGERSLVSLAPGESAENEIVLREMVVPAELIKGKRSRVEMSCKWSRVWLRARSELTEEQIRELGDDGTAVSGEVHVDGIEIVTE